MRNRIEIKQKSNRNVGIKLKSNRNKIEFNQKLMKSNRNKTEINQKLMNHIGIKQKCTNHTGIKQKSTGNPLEIVNQMEITQKSTRNL